MIASGRIQRSLTKHDEVLRPRKMSRYAGKNAFKLRALRTVDVGRLSCTKGLGNWNQNRRTSSVSGLDFVFLHALHRLNWRSRSIPSTAGSPSVLIWHGHEARGRLLYWLTTKFPITKMLPALLFFHCLSLCVCRRGIRPYGCGMRILRFNSG